MAKTFLIAAGGTGGHIFPGLAAAEALKSAGHHVVWLGASGGMEADLVPRRGLPIHLITISGWRGQGLSGWIGAPVRLLRALWQTARVFSRERPDCVLGMGGFAAGPGGLMAWLRRVPLVIHEQNAIPGMTNRNLARISARVLKGFDSAFAEQGQAAIWVGNPVRGELFAVPAVNPQGGGQRKLRLLVLGGSRGALALNEGLPEAVSRLPESLRPEITHQAGRGKADACIRAYEQSGVSAQVVEFVDDMQSAYTRADLVVARAGALTLAELAATGRGAVLVPYPYAADDHQTANARDFEAAGAARVIPQGDAFEERLGKALEALLGHPEQLALMGRSATALARPGAAAEVARICMEVVEA